MCSVQHGDLKPSSKIPLPVVKINKFWKKRSLNITDYDPVFKVVYLGNVLTGWAKGEGCVERPLATLWRNYCGSNKADMVMKLSVGYSGLKGSTKQHGLTEYFANRITYCCAPAHYPRIFSWIYRHDGRKLKQELRCHAVLCSREEKAREMADLLQACLNQSLQEFRREKILRQNARLCLANSAYENPSLPRRKIILSTGTLYYRPPPDKNRCAPKLNAIEECLEEQQFEEVGEKLKLDLVVEESESTSDIVPDYDSLSEEGKKEECGGLLCESELLCGECGVVDTTCKHMLQTSYLPDARLTADGELADQDNISDESGYSEDKEFMLRV